MNCNDFPNQDQLYVLCGSEGSFWKFGECQTDVIRGYLGLGLKNYAYKTETLRYKGVEFERRGYLPYRSDQRKKTCCNWSHCFGGLTECQDILAFVAGFFIFFIFVSPPILWKCITKLPDYSFEKAFFIMLIMPLEPR